MRRALVLGVVATIALTGFEPVASTEPAEDAVYLVDGRARATLAATGSRIVKDYGGHITARMTTGQVAALEEEGIAVVSVNYTVARGSYEVGGSIPVSLRAGPEVTWAVVQFDGPIDAEGFAMMEEASGGVFDYIHHYAFLVKATEAQREELLRQPHVRLVSRYHPAFKISQDIGSGSDLSLTVLVTLLISLDDAIDEVRAAGGTIRSATTTKLEHLLRIRIDRSDLNALAALDSVLWIERSHDRGSSHNDEGSAISQSGATASWPIHARGVNGSTQGP